MHTLLQSLRNVRLGPTRVHICVLVLGRGVSPLLVMEPAVVLQRAHVTILMMGGVPVGAAAHGTATEFSLPLHGEGACNATMHLALGSKSGWMKHSNNQEAVH
jgi:hypothetical protein